jgi:hypothetical protein
MPRPLPPFANHASPPSLAALDYRGTGWHVWEIVKDAPYARQARAQILDWIRAKTRAR